MNGVPLFSLTDPTHLLAGIVAVVTCHFAYSLWFHPLANIPGPLQGRLGLGYMTTRMSKRDVGSSLYNLHERYGQIVRIGRNAVSVADPEAIPEIYRHGGSWQKTEFYNWFRGSFENLFSIRNVADHAAMRRVDAPAYTTNYLVSLQSLVDPVVEDLVKHLERRIEESPAGTASCQMSETLQYVAMDTRTQPRFGIPFFLSALLTTGIAVSGPEKTLRFNLELVTDRVKVINEATASGGNDRKDMTTKFMSSKSAHLFLVAANETVCKTNCLARLFQGFKGLPRTTVDVSESTAAVLTAGTDTTAITMRALLRYIVGDARVYQRLQEEIDDAYDKRDGSSPISYAEGCSLEYFQACLKEALRLHPAVQSVLPRVVPSGGAVLCGRFLPAGTEVGISPYVLHRQPSAFGPDALLFRPERWLEADEAGKKVMDRNHIPFGAGSRTCVGKHISLMEITKVFPTILHRFEFAFTPRTPTSPHTLPGLAVDGSLDPSEPWHVRSGWFSPQYDFWVDVKARTAIEA
ncbi:hypothetical protein RQP46_010906 [Phenoliferia psychrophenolica]